MSRQRPLSLLTILAMLPAAPPAVAQQQAPLSRTEVVQLDVIVTDADGKPVRGLTEADFEVLEDKKAQRITNFVFVEGRLRAEGGAAPGTPAASADAPAGAAEEPPAGPGRHMVIVIDDLHIAPGNFDFVKGALQRLVAQFLGPDDSVAMLTTSSPAGSKQLTQDKAAIQQEIALLKFNQPGMPPAARSEMTPAQAELILRGDRSARRLAGQMLLDQPGSVLSDPASPRAATQQGEAAIASSNAGAEVSRESQEAIAEREAERQARAVLNDALRHSVATLHAVEDVLRSLAPLPGRKLCLLVSDGFLVGAGTSEERTRDMRAIVDAATRSGAVVYAVDTKGLQGASLDASIAGNAASPGLQASVDRQGVQLVRLTLENIAEDTGGYLVTGTNAFDDGLKRVLRENDSYYLMAYEPSNKKRDGKFRRIEVRVKRPVKYVVRTRAGYLAPDDSKPASKPAVRQASAAPEPRGIEETEARAIIDASRSETGLPLHLAADFVEVPPDGALAVVRAHADVSALTEGADAGVAVDFLGGVYDASGKAVGPAFGRHTPVPAAALAQARKEGVFFQQRLALPPGRYEIRLAARDLSRTKLGGASQWVEIPDLKTGALTLSGLFLSTATPKAAGAGGEDLRDVQALRRFKNRDSLFFQVYVYNLRGEAEGASDAVLQAQLRQGETLVAASQPQPIKLERKDGALLPQTNGMPLESLPRGSYQLRVVVMDKKANATVNRQVDFTIE
ncbi:MAG TPA: VWA domain-containing protein [Vicinamibacteria bacterium]|jgi:VWFA-related protein